MSAKPRLEPSQAENLLDLGTRRLFSAEHDMLRESARRFFKEKVAPFHSKWEEQGIVPREVWKAAGNAGLLSVTVPEKYGGAEADILSAAVIWEEQAYTGFFGPGFSIHSEICVPYLVNYGSEEQKKKYLPGACSGDTIVAIAMTEPGAGSDLQGVGATAVRDGNDFILNGQKVFISNGQLADVVIVVAKTNLKASKAAHGISLLLVDAGTPGFTKGKNLKKIGLKAQDTSELFF